MFAFLAPFVASRYFRPVIAGMLVLVLLAIILMTAMCGRSDQAAKQAQQTNRSGDAITAAASEAIQIIGDRVVSDKIVDQAVSQTTKGVTDAKTADDLRNAVLDGLCKTDSHRLDPGCKLRRSNPH